MIRHHPSGRGHPYLIEPDQRFPLRPSTGAGFTVGATTSADVRGVQVELERGGTLRTVAATRSVQAAPRGRTGYGVVAPRASDGHLADLATPSTDDGRVAWSLAHEPLSAGEPVRYRFVSESDETPWFQVSGCAWTGEGGRLAIETPAACAERVVPESILWLSDGTDTYACRFAIRLDDGERVVGFGERFNGLDQRGKLLETSVFDQYKGQGARSYLPMPFAIVVGGGFGFHLDTGYPARFDIAQGDPQLIQVEVELEPGVRNVELRLNLFAGAPAEVLRRFLDQVGRPPEPPPEWIYRLWMSGNEWNSQARVLAEVERSEQEGIAVGAVVIEAWSDEETFVAFNGAVYEPHADGSPHRLADFSFPAEGAWPDPKGLVEQLHAKGVKVLLWQIPLAKRADSGQAAHDIQTILACGYCVTDDDGSPYGNPAGWFNNDLLIDFTNPQAVEWWLAKRRYLIEEIGVDGFKTDGGEHAWSPELRYADGSRGGETNNRYPVLYANAYHAFLQRSGKHPVTFSRAGYAGSQAVPAHWAGDDDSSWEALRSSISAGLTASACGIFFWAFDLAGFSGPLPSAELYLRSTAVAALSPIMQYHSEYNHHRQPSRDRTPWNVAEQTSEPQVLGVFRRFVQLRERLVPYLAEQGARSISTGKPLMRALCFEIDNDERIWEFPEQYFLGDHLLVAPITEPGARTWRVYVPPGQWIDAWTGEHWAGAQIIERDVPLDRIPVFVSAARAAALAPLFVDLDDQESALQPTELERIS